MAISECFLRMDQPYPVWGDLGYFARCTCNSAYRNGPRREPTRGNVIHWMFLKLKFNYNKEKNPSINKPIKQNIVTKIEKLLLFLVPCLYVHVSSDTSISAVENSWWGWVLFLKEMLIKTVNVKTHQRRIQLRFALIRWFVSTGKLLGRYKQGNYTFKTLKWTFWGFNAVGIRERM